MIPKHMGGAVLCLLVGVSAGMPPGAACPLKPEMSGHVTAILDAETIGLSDGSQVRLINMLSPRRPLWLAPERAWPAADYAEAALKGLVAGAQVDLSFDQRRMDRNGRLLAQVYVLKARGRLWVQGEMIGRGHARAYSLPSSRACVHDLLGREDEARRQGLGLWRMAFYAVRPARPAAEIIKLKNAFGIVEGTVQKVARVGSRTYLNFEKDWRHDFTVILERQAVRLFASAEIDPASFEGTRIRVRGWVGSFNGPMIETTHPEQIELLDE